jgi:hypothetical protein
MTLSQINRISRITSATGLWSNLPPLNAVTLEKLQFSGQPRVVCTEPK